MVIQLKIENSNGFTYTLRGFGVLTFGIKKQLIKDTTHAMIEIETVTLVLSIRPIKVPVMNPLIIDGLLYSLKIDASDSKANKVSRLS